MDHTRYIISVPRSALISMDTIYALAECNLIATRGWMSHDGRFWHVAFATNVVLSRTQIDSINDVLNHDDAVTGYRVISPRVTRESLVSHS